MDQRNLNAKASIVNIAAEVENVQQESVMKLKSAKMVHATLHKDLQLSKKSVRWVTEMVYEEMQRERLRTCKAVMMRSAATS
jgi:hypothetical protein